MKASLTSFGKGGERRLRVAPVSNREAITRGMIDDPGFIIFINYVQVIPVSRWTVSILMRHSDRINKVMRTAEILDEVTLGNWTYYHGTPTQHAAQQIISNGLHPSEMISRRNLAPQAGYVYLTPHLQYAMRYVMGFGMLNDDRLRYRIPIEGNEEKLKWLIRDGRYGYLFVVHRNTIKSKLHPDEDAVGVLYSAAKSGEIHFYLEDFLPETVLAVADNDPAMFKRFVTHVETVVSASTRGKLLNDYQNSDQMIGWASKVGKIALRRMNTELLLWLVTIGVHVGHAGALRPDEAWRFDRRKVGWLDNDAANFFDLAERIG